MPISSINSSTFNFKSTQIHNKMNMHTPNFKGDEGYDEYVQPYEDYETVQKNKTRKTVKIIIGSVLAAALTLGTIFL